MQQEPVGYTLTLFGGTITFAFTDVLQVVGMLGMIVGLILTWRGQQMRIKEQNINIDRTAEMKRANDIKERELCQSKKP